MNDTIREMLSNPDVYSFLRLRAELESSNIRDIRDHLDFEITTYEELPDLLLHNYQSYDHFLAYVSEVRKYDTSTFDK